VIGIILLIGIVKKNAIMMIDFALDAERREGKRPEEAIYQACLLRFRPIMMTTMAALLGGLPLALGTGTGSELHRPLGITIVGGLIVSQMLTLFYYKNGLNRFQNKCIRRRLRSVILSEAKDLLCSCARKQILRLRFAPVAMTFPWKFWDTPIRELSCLHATPCGNAMIQPRELSKEKDLARLASGNGHIERPRGKWDGRDDMARRLRL
jgi:hypothetical protein